MDDSIQILIFVVTFIVFIVSAIMKQKKKPNAKSSNFESIVESFFGIPQENIKLQNEESQQDYYRTEYNQTDATQNKSFEMRRDDMASLIENEGIKGISATVCEKANEFIEDEEPAVNFDVRQAIIYSEILNRKYF